MIKKNRIIILGLMSGTSLDGLDLALCSFEFDEEKYSFCIIEAEAYDYSKEIKEKLSSCHNYNAFEFIKFHKEYGFYLGEMVNKFLEDCTEKPDYLASHGHTVFHQPESKITFQIGDGAAISAVTGIDVISDFRNLDVCLGGQGAPLVPIGDKYLFPDYDYCINIGGFANLSFEKNNVRLAYDICPANIFLNLYAGYFNMEYDKDGEIGRKGIIDKVLLEKLNSLPYYNRDAPKSLGREWFEREILSLMDSNENKSDLMRTFYEHIAEQISLQIDNDDSKVLLTGGGAHNTFLVELIKDKCKAKVIVPEKQVVDFKEALIFGFLAYLNILKKDNCLKSVTGADRDNIGGTLHCGIA